MQPKVGIEHEENHGAYHHSAADRQTVLSMSLLITRTPINIA